MGMELTKEPASRGLTEEQIIHIPGLMSRWVRLASGAKAHYVTCGDSGPAVVLLHGGIVGSSGTAGWRFMAPFLGANGMRVYCPDMPGFGWADTREEHRPVLGTTSHVQFINDFADALCLDQFFLGGNSMGMGNTVQYTIAHPERVKGMLLIAGGMGDLVDPSKAVARKDARWTTNPDYAREPFDGTEQSMKELMEGIIYKPGQVWPELVTMRSVAANRQYDSYLAYQLGNERMNGVRTFQPSIKMPANLPPLKGPDFNLQQLLSTKNRFNRLTIPGVYLYGLQDVLSPVEGGFDQEDLGLENIQYFYPDDCGHQGQTDQPEMFNQVAVEFFRDGKVSWKTAEWAGVSRRSPIDPKLVEEPPGGFPKSDIDFYERLTREAKSQSDAKAGAR
jgi:2-hydroxy-6-oxonona-2,4-dienedioate hydrolase